MKRIFFIIFLFIGFLTNAQHEIGISAGASNLLGDFGGGPGKGTIFLKDLDIKSTRPAFGLFYRYNFRRFFGVRAQVFYANFYSNDKYSAEASRFSRDFNSSTSYLDASLQFEYNLIPLDFCSGEAKFTPYIATGIGLIMVNPSVGPNYQNDIPAEELQYVTNGQHLVANLPLSLGVKYKTKKNLVLGLESSYRMTLSDKLDNYVRQEKDHYIITTLNLSYVFCKSKGMNKIQKQGGCYKF